MVSALDSGSSGPGLGHGWEHLVVFLGKTLHSHSKTLHSDVQLGTGEFNAGGNPAMDPGQQVPICTSGGREATTMRALCLTELTLL